MTRWELTVHVLTVRSMVHSLDREMPREIFADGSWESETPRFPESVVFEDLATVKAPVVSDCGSVVSSSSPEELVYCRQMSWKKSSCPALYNLAHALKEDKLGKGRAHAPY
jgi:hypothetical protein